MFAFLRSSTRARLFCSPRFSNPRSYASSSGAAAAGIGYFGVAAIASAAGGAYFFKDKISSALGLQNSKAALYQKAYAEIVELLDDEDYDDGSFAPVFLRLAWHAAGTYSQYDKVCPGGSGTGATMRFAPESNHAANAGLVVARRRLESVKQKFPQISYADIWSLAGVAAVQEMGGPKIKWRSGRKDATSKECPPEGRLPDAALGAVHIRKIFGRMGFDDEEMVALIGAHAVGRCHEKRSGFDGPWTFSPTTFSNAFFKLLLDEKWIPRVWSGPPQMTDARTESLMMLPTDMALVQDPAFRVISERFAGDEREFFAVFARAFQKLEELGCKNLEDEIVF